MTSTMERRNISTGQAVWQYSFRWRRLVHLVALSVVIETLWFAFAGFEMRNTLPLFGGLVQRSSAPLTRCTAGASVCAASFKAPPPFVGPITDLLIYLLPAIVAVAFITPSLAKEFESKTARFAWTQSVTRHQWFTSRAAAALAAALMVAGIGQLELQRWVFPHYFQSTPPWAIFSFSGTAAVAISLFLAAASILIALVIKRPVPAVILSAVLFGASIFAVSTLYPTTLAPKRVKDSFGQILTPKGALYVTTTMVTRSGEKVSQKSAGQIINECQLLFPPTQVTKSNGTGIIVGPQSQQAYTSCLTAHDLYFETSYQPSYRYWELQWVFTGIALFLAAVATVAAFLVTKKMEI